MKSKALMNMLGTVALVLMISGAAIAQRSEVVSAQWGIPGNRVDVTARVRTFEQNGVLRFVVTRGALGIDPAPHRNKDLIIRVRRPDGQVEEFNYPERGTVELQLVFPEDHSGRDRDARDGDGWHDREAHDGDRWHDRDARDGDRRRDEAAERSGLQIRRAFYGVEGQFADVTDALRGRVDGDRLYLRVDNFHLGVDPAPGQQKVLHIVYSFHGHRNEMTVNEKSYVQLP